jgi:hypothetical protein
LNSCCRVEILGREFAIPDAVTTAVRRSVARGREQSQFLGLQEDGFDHAKVAGNLVVYVMWRWKAIEGTESGMLVTQWNKACCPNRPLLAVELAVLVKLGSSEHSERQAGRCSSNPNAVLCD